MGSRLPKGIRRALSAILAAVAFVGLGVSLSGCPVAADLEDRERFPYLSAAGSGSVACDQDLPGPSTAGIMCDYEGAMKAHCARAGCHNATTQSAKLDLTVDTLLIARILDEPSKHIISCPTAEGGGQCNLSAPQCADTCNDCPSGPTDVLLSKASPGTGWIIEKMERFDVVTSMATKISCGTAMPYPPGNTGFTEARRTCLKDFFTWIANNGRPCSIPMGGSGGGGPGGAGGAGSGGGGAGGTGGT